MADLRAELASALGKHADVATVEAAIDDLCAVVDGHLWRARNIRPEAGYDRCRTCRAKLTKGASTPSGEHRMGCRHYIGPIEHRWIRESWNGTFGGVEHFCACGGYFRAGGLCGHGDEGAEPVCPNAAVTERKTGDHG